MPKILEVKNVSKHFHLHIQNNKRIAALDDVSFEMEQGEILGLTGKSGSGKSSLMKCIYRTYLVNSGEIVLTTASRGPVDLAKASEHEVIEMRKTEMFYCSQFLSVIPRVPAVEIVAEPLARKGKPPMKHGRWPGISSIASACLASFGTRFPRHFPAVNSNA